MQDEIKKIKIYHLYDNKKRPRTTVAIIEDTYGLYHKGIAYCSRLDFGALSNKRGKQIALGRAKKAMKLKDDILPIKRRNVIDILNCWFKGSGGLQPYQLNKMDKKVLASNGK